MEDKVSFNYIYEDIQYRNHKREIRSYILIVFLILILFVSNLIWILRELSYEDVVTTESITYTADSEDNGVAIINEEGEVHVNGKSI